MSSTKRNSRRDVLKTLGAGAFAATLGGCASIPSSGKDFERVYSRKPMIAPRISVDNVIRVIVGHRPYRPSGFVVKGEKFDDKLVVHNYGHGGNGISMSWGSSALAVRETMGMDKGEVAVVGGGVMGLTSARLLQDAGWKVTIYTKNVARHAVSNVAAGIWVAGGVDESKATPAFRSQYNWAARIAHHAYTNLVGPDYGIRWIETYYMTSEPPSEDNGGRTSDLLDLSAYSRDYLPGEHPFPSSQHVRVNVTMLVETATFLRRLTEDFHQAGGRLEIRDFKDRADVLSLSEPVIFNCSGLGAKALFGDDELTPQKGQLVFMPPDPDVDYITFGGGPGYLYMFPRTDAVVLGGTTKIGDWSTHAEADETARIITEHKRIFSGFA